MGDEKAANSADAGVKNSLPPSRYGRGWNLAFGLFLYPCGLANIYIVTACPQDIWVSFEVFGLTALAP